MKICPECKTELLDTQNVCPNCGKYVPFFVPERPSGFSAVVTEEPVVPEEPSPAPIEEISVPEPAVASPVWNSPEPEDEKDDTFPDIPYPEPLEMAVTPTVLPEEEPEEKLPRILSECVPTPSVGSFILTFILCAIPVVGFFYFFALVFGKTKYPAKKNYARAILVLALISLVLSAVVVISGGFAAGLLTQLQNVTSSLSA